MNRISSKIAVALGAGLLAAAASLSPACAAEPKAPASAPEQPYSKGHVWRFGFMKAEPKNAYLASLAPNYVKIAREAQRQGVILSFKVLSSDPSPGDQWNVVLLLEFANMAALDGWEDKFGRIARQLEEQNPKAGDTANRDTLRTYLGARLATEIDYK